MMLIAKSLVALATRARNVGMSAPNREEHARIAERLTLDVYEILDGLKANNGDDYIRDPMVINFIDRKIALATLHALLSKG